MRALCGPFRLRGSRVPPEWPPSAWTTGGGGKIVDDRGNMDGLNWHDWAAMKRCTDSSQIREDRSSATQYTWETPSQSVNKHHAATNESHVFDFVRFALRMMFWYEHLMLIFYTDEIRVRCVLVKYPAPTDQPEWYSVWVRAPAFVWKHLTRFSWCLTHR